MRGLNGKRILITGGASGIGAATSERFIKEGAHVVVLDHNEAILNVFAKENPQLVGTILADVSQHDAVDKGFDTLKELLGGLDVLINNAGISLRHTFLDTTPEEWRQVMSVNLDGVFYTAQFAARLMLEEDGGVILNMGSTNGLVGYHHYADYNASKAGVIELTRSMALELAPKIRVNVICPGFILTPMQKSEYTPEMVQSFAHKLPLQRLGNPEDVAALFAFLASDDARFITGGVYVIDGGEIAGGLASQA